MSSDEVTYEFRIENLSTHQYELEGVFSSINEISNYMNIPATQLDKVLAGKFNELPEEYKHFVIVAKYPAKNCRVDLADFHSTTAH